MSKLVFRGETGMRVMTTTTGSVQLWPDRSPVAVTMSSREWADVARCAELLGPDLRDAEEIS